MKTTVTLPFDILEHIANILGVQSDKRTLRALSRICKFMVPPCRRYLFSSISLTNVTTPKATSLARFLSEAPDIICHIKELEYVIKTQIPTSQHINDVFEVLGSLSTSLQSFTLLSYNSSDWNALQEPTKSLLMSLIQLPTIIYLHLALCQNFPLVATSLCTSGLTDIKLIHNNVSEENSGNYSSSISIRRSKTRASVSLDISGLNSAISVLMDHLGPNPIDFGCLEKASIEICSANEAFQMAELLKTAAQLRTLRIYYVDPFQLPVGGLGSSLAVNAYQTLRSLTLSLDVDDEHYDPLCGLTLELQHFSGNNVLEELVVSVYVGLDRRCHTDSDDWSDLDVVLTHQGAFPMLHRVTVKLFWCSNYRQEWEVEDKCLRRVTQDQFPRLLKSPAVEFVFREEHEYL